MFSKWYYFWLDGRSCTINVLKYLLSGLVDYVINQTQFLDFQLRHPHMSVTPSISSARSLLSPSDIRNEQNQRIPGISPSVYSFSTKSLPSAKLPSEGLSLNPDELFTRYTVSEVRAVQHRLRWIFFLRSVIAYLFYVQSGCRCKAGGTSAYGWVRIFGHERLWYYFEWSWKRRERYRDLLQASSSIISIAQSSRHVCEALEECRNAIISQNDLPLPPVTATENNVNGMLHLSWEHETC